MKEEFEKEFKQAIDKTFKFYREYFEKIACSECPKDCDKMRKDLEALIRFTIAIFKISANSFSSATDLSVQESRRFMLKVILKELLSEEVDAFIDSIKFASDESPNYFV